MTDIEYYLWFSIGVIFSTIPWFFLFVLIWLGFEVKGVAKKAFIAFVALKLLQRLRSNKIEPTSSSPSSY